MAVTRAEIFAEVAANLPTTLKSYTVSGAATSYSEAAAGTIVSGTNFISTDFPKARIEAACIDGEMDLIYEICNTAQHPDRAAFLLDSATHTSGSVIPTQSSGGVKFIGPISSVRDASTNKICTPAQVAAVRMMAENENSMYGTSLHNYAIDGEVLIHTRSGGVIVKRAGYTRPSFSGNIALPDQYKPAIVSAALIHLLTKEGMNQAAYNVHTALYNGWAQAIRAIGQAPSLPAATSYPAK